MSKSSIARMVLYPSMVVPYRICSSSGALVKVAGLAEPDTRTKSKRTSQDYWGERERATH